MTSPSSSARRWVRRGSQGKPQPGRACVRVCRWFPYVGTTTDIHQQFLAAAGRSDALESAGSWGQDLQASSTLQYEPVRPGQSVKYHRQQAEVPTVQNEARSPNALSPAPLYPSDHHRALTSPYISPMLRLLSHALLPSQHHILYLTTPESPILPIWTTYRPSKLDLVGVVKISIATLSAPRRDTTR